MEAAGMIACRVQPPGGGSCGEASESYPRVVATLSPRHRVIACRDGLQWIVQRRRNGGNDRAWVGRSYCASREALIRVVAGVEPDLDHQTMRTLEALPDRITR